MPAKKEEKPKKEGEGKGKENKPVAKKPAAPAKEGGAKKPAGAPKKGGAKKPAAPQKGGAKKPAAKVSKKAAAGKKLGVKKESLKKSTTKKGETTKVAKGRQSGKGGKKITEKPTKKLSKYENIFFKPKKVVKRAPLGREQPNKRDLSRYVRWPRYVRIQKQRKIIMARLKVPPAVFQFTRTLDKANAIKFLEFADKYRLESSHYKKARLIAAARSKIKGVSHKAKRPITVVAGLSAVTRAIEQKKAKLVVIANDVHPIELVAWLPNLCRKLEVPYVVIKGRARLGHISRTKTCSAIAFTKVRSEDTATLKTLADTATELFNDNADIRKQWGGGVLSTKRQNLINKRQRILAQEMAARASKKA